MAENDDGPNSTNSLISGLTLESSGIYSAVVRGYGEADSGTYAIFLESQVLKGSISPGAIVTGWLEPGIQDLWLFEGNAGSAVSFDLDGDNSAAPSLALIGPNSDYLIGEPGTGVRLDSRFQNVPLLASGIYTIALRHPGGGGEYQLVLTEGSADSISFGQSVPFTTTPGLRLWHFSGESGDRVIIELTATSQDEFDSSLNGEPGLLDSNYRELRRAMGSVIDRWEPPIRGPTLFWWRLPTRCNHRCYLYGVNVPWVRSNSRRSS